MKTIWKFPLEVTDEQTVEIPSGAQLLSVQNQHETACLWAVVDPEAEKKPCVIQIYGTGHPIEEVGTYLSTFQMHGGSLVFHAFIKH
jgi:hypothetical protein